MSKPLIPTGALISSSWQLFIKNWKVTLKLSSWLLLPVVLLSLPLFLNRATGETELEPLLGTVSGIAMIFGLLFSIHISIRLTELILAQDRGETPKALNVWKASPLFFSYLWIVLLTAVVTGIGYFLLIVPGIWVGVSVWAGIFLLLEDGIKGKQALRASIALIKGRWWSALWRMLAPGLVFVLLYFAALFALLLLLSGFRLFVSINEQGIFFNILQGIVQVAFAPLILTAQVKLFHSLKESR